MLEKALDREADLIRRETLVMSAIALFLGLGVFQVSWYRESDASIDGEVATRVLQALLTATLLIYAGCFVYLFLRQIRLERVPLVIRVKLAMLEAGRRLRCSCEKGRNRRRSRGRELRARLYALTTVAPQDPLLFLELPDELVDKKMPEDSKIMSGEIFIALAAAYYEQDGQNRLFERDLNKCQIALLAGLAINALVLLVFLWLVVP